MSKKFTLILIPVLIFFLTAPLVAVFAQEDQATTSEEEIIAEVEQELKDEQNILPEDLEVKDPRLLPDSPFYFFKNWGRSLRLLFTRDPLKQAELRERFASEKLIELKKLAEKTKDPKVLEKAKKNYENEMERIKQLAERIKTKTKDKKKVESFLDKFIRHQILHQKLLDKLEEQVPPETFEKIKEARERHLDRFKEVMLKLEDKDKLPERLQKALEKTKGSDLKDFKHLEILRRLRERAQNEENREIFEKVEENILEKLKGKLEKLPEEKRKRIRYFIERLPGDKEKHLEILEDLRERFGNQEEIQKQLREGREGILERLMEKKKKVLEKMNCPEWTPPAPGFCEEGRIIIRRDENGCPLPPICINPEQIQERVRNQEGEVCAQLWDPVCGKDGKTYSNPCFAKIAGVEIAHKGICEDVVPKCAKEGERVNRNPFLGPTNRVCCPGLVEKRVSRSYSICTTDNNSKTHNINTCASFPFKRIKKIGVILNKTIERRFLY